MYNPLIEYLYDNYCCNRNIYRVIRCKRFQSPVILPH